MLFLGIDPGKSGWLVLLREDGGLEYALPFSFDAAMSRAVEGCKVGIIMAALEKVHPISRKGKPEGVKSTFSFGCNVGLWHGLLLANKIPFEEISPATWQKVLPCRSQTKPIKDQVWEWACKRWPEAQLSGPRGRKRYGFSDALGMAEWLRLREKGGQA